MFFIKKHNKRIDMPSNYCKILNHFHDVDEKNTAKLPLLLLMFLLGLIFLLIRAKYGFCFNDEPFCVTLGQRLYKGDALISDEWHGCQLFSGIMLPFYAFFRLFSSTNEGILLFLRHVYCTFWWICCICVSISIGKSVLNRAIVFLFLLFFSPLDYMTVSYTSFGLMSALGICCILYKLPNHAVRPEISVSIIFSLLWAVLILCCPLMILAYLGLLIGSFFGASFEKKTASNITYFHNLLSVFRFAFIIDIVLAVLYILFFVLLRADLSTILRSIPHILSDPEHQFYGLFSSVRNMVFSVYNQSRLYVTVSCITFLYALITRPCRSRIVLFGINALLYVFSQIHAVRTPYHFNVQMLPIIFLGMSAFSLLRKKDWKLFFSFYGFCAFYTLLNGLTSNTGIMAISMTATVAGCSAVIFIMQLSNEFREEYKQIKTLKIISFGLVCCILCFQIFSNLYVKLTRQYWDAPPYQLTETISCGAAKGLKTTPEIAKDYSVRYDALTYLLDQVDTSGKKFLSCTSAPYIYLDADLDFATFSAWSFGYDSSLNDRILTYQQVNPENTADIIFCASSDDILPLIDNSYIQYKYNGHFLYVRDHERIGKNLYGSKKPSQIYY